MGHLDDILVIEVMEKQHLERLEEVVKRLKMNGQN